jgi:hypothetical protein
VWSVLLYECGVGLAGCADGVLKGDGGHVIRGEEGGDFGPHGVCLLVNLLRGYDVGAISEPWVSWFSSVGIKTIWSSLGK